MSLVAKRVRFLDLHVSSEEETRSPHRGRKRRLRFLNLHTLGGGEGQVSLPPYLRHGKDLISTTLTNEGADLHIVGKGGTHPP